MSCVPPISLRPAALFRLPTIVIAIGAAMMPATAAEPTTQELAAKLRETLTGLHTVEMQYRETQNFEGRTTSNEHEWLRSGEKIRLIIHEGDLPGDWCSFDGRFGYNVDYFPDRPLDIRNINKTTTTPGGLARNMPGNWLGLRLQELPSRDLADLLEQPEARIIATETFDGMPAYRVDLGEHQTQQGAFVWTTVICPERDGLPVEISREPAESNPDGERLRNLVGPVRLFVTAFYEVHDAALQRTRWLPQRMRRETKPATLDLETSLSRVNHEVPEAAFVPQPQPGTQMIDETVPGGITVRVHQPEAALARQAADLAKEVRPIAAPTTPPVVAAPAGSWWSTMFLWGGAIALLCAAVVYIVRMRRTS